MVWAVAGISQTAHATDSSLTGEVIVVVDPGSSQVAHPTAADTGSTTKTILYPAPAGTTELQLSSLNGSRANVESTNGTTSTLNLVTHTYQVAG